MTICKAVKARPIIFSVAMVQAILEGRKTQTRRLVKQSVNVDEIARHGSLCPYGEPGVRLWVREKLICPDGDSWLYAADRQAVMVDPEDETAMIVWAHHKVQDYCSSMFMPRWASRITLEITGVRMERLQDLSEADARAEGCQTWGLSQAEFQVLWASIHGKDSWGGNPWVWVIEFKRVQP